MKRFASTTNLLKANTMSDVSTTHRYFNLFHFIDNIMSPEIAAPVAVSTARKVDFMITNAARQLFKSMKVDAAACGIDLFADMKAAVNQAAYAESVFDEYGSTNTGVIATIKELMYQREMYHGQAARLTALTNDFSGKPKTYIERSLEDQILNPTPGKVAGNIQNRYRIQTKRNADAMGMPEEAANLLAKRLAAAEADKLRMTDNLKDQGAAVLMVLELACKYNLEDVERPTTTEFTSLSVPTQIELLHSTLQAIAMADKWATDNNKLSDSEWDVASLSAIKATKDIQAVLKSPTYAHHAQQEAAAAVNVG